MVNVHTKELWVRFLYASDNSTCKCTMDCTEKPLHAHIPMSTCTSTKSHGVKGTCILFQFLFLMEKSILYAKITVSQKNFFSKFSFKYYIGLLFS